jgi:hypothetical protein
LIEIVLQEHRTSKSVEQKVKSPIQQRRKKRNRYEFILFKIIFNYQNFSLKDFICNSSSSSAEEEKEDPLEFYPKINRLIDQDSSWRK